MYSTPAQRLDATRTKRNVAFGVAGLGIAATIIIALVINLALFLGSAFAIVWGIVTLASGNPPTLWNIGAIVLGGLILAGLLFSRTSR